MFSKKLYDKICFYVWLQFSLKKLFDFDPLKFGIHHFGPPNDLDSALLKRENGLDKTWNIQSSVVQN